MERARFGEEGVVRRSTMETFTMVDSGSVRAVARAWGRERVSGWGVVWPVQARWIGGLGVGGWMRRIVRAAKGRFWRRAWAIGVGRAAKVCAGAGGAGVGSCRICRSIVIRVACLVVLEGEEEELKVFSICTHRAHVCPTDTWKQFNLINA